MKKSLTFSALVIGALIGASALSVWAQSSGSWTAPTATPPGNNIAAPINVSTAPQAKSGLLGLSNFLFNPAWTSGSVATGSILTALDSDGTVGWGTGGSGSGGSCSVSITNVVAGTVYQNTTGQEIFVTASINSTSGSKVINGFTSANSADIASLGDADFSSPYLAASESGSDRGSISFIVRPGYYYRVYNSDGVIDASATTVCGGSGGSGSSDPFTALKAKYGLQSWPSYVVCMNTTLTTPGAALVLMLEEVNLNLYRNIPGAAIAYVTAGTKLGQTIDALYNSSGAFQFTEPSSGDISCPTQLHLDSRITDMGSLGN